MLFSHAKPSGAVTATARDPAATHAEAPRGFVEERPPPGLARGKYPASPWTIALVGALLLLVTVGYFVRRWQRLRS